MSIRKVRFLMKKIEKMYSQTYLLDSTLKLLKEVRVMKIYRAFKFRLYPTEEQRILIHKTFGVVVLFIIII